MNHVSRCTLCVVALLFTFSACGGDAEPDAADMADVAPESTEEMAEDTVAALPEGVTRLNINTATAEEMGGIPGVGDRMIHEFEEYRPYVSIQQFRQEIGKYVDDEMVAAYEQYIFVPIRPNESDAATLQQLPGVDAEEAQALIDARPFASSEAFVDALGAYVSEEEGGEAGMYLADER